MIKRNRHVANRARIKEHAPDVHLPERYKMPKAHEDWFSSGIAISDHAVVRFLQICGGIDMSQVRAAMIAGKEKLIKMSRDCKIPLDDVGKLVIRNGVVVTVLRITNKKNGGAK